MAEDFQRRMPAREREIADIRPEDIRVSLTGTVIDRSPEGTQLVLDDGTGRISVTSDDPLRGEVNQTIRVFGRLIPLESGYELQAEIVQNMDKLDRELARRVKDLKI